MPPPCEVKRVRVCMRSSKDGVAEGLSSGEELESDRRKGQQRTPARTRSEPSGIASSRFGIVHHSGDDNVRARPARLWIRPGVDARVKEERAKGTYRGGGLHHFERWAVCLYGTKAERRRSAPLTGT